METLKTKNRVTSTFLTKLLKNESLLPGNKSFIGDKGPSGNTEQGKLSGD